MDKRGLKRVLGRGTLFLVALMLGASSFFSSFAGIVELQAKELETRKVETEETQNNVAERNAEQSDEATTGEQDSSADENVEADSSTEDQTASLYEGESLDALGQDVLTNGDLNLNKEAPPLPQANEVAISEQSTLRVSTAEEFFNAYTNKDISRIVLTRDIDLSEGPADKHGKLKDFQTEIAKYHLTRSLQIDGNNHVLKSTSFAGDQFAHSSTLALFSLGKIGGAQQTIHLKDVDVWTRGLNYINKVSSEEGWQLILDNARFKKNNHDAANYTYPQREFDQVLRVARMPRGQIFLRNNVFMQSSGENFYAGQITVEPNATVFGEISYHDWSTWYFELDGTSFEQNVNIGEGANVELVGQPLYKHDDPNSGILHKNATFPTIYQHWQAINVHKGATLKATKPGHAYKFSHITNKNKHKEINVFEGATIEGTTTMAHLVAHGVLDEIGPAIGHFYAAPGSNVKFKSGGATPVVNLKKAESTFVLNQPEEYDIRNSFEQKNAKAVIAGRFMIIKSDINVWDGTKDVGWWETRERHLSGPADYTWPYSTIVADKNGNPLAGTSQDQDLIKTWNTTKYSRISGFGLVGNPVLQFERLTDANKSATVNVFASNRVVTREGAIKIRVTNDKDDTVFEGTNNTEGKFIFTLPNDAFFKAGTTYTATAERADGRGKAEEVATVTVEDVTPPEPVAIDGDVLHTTDSITGTNGEPGAKVSATLRRGDNGPFEILTSAQNNIVGDDGQWGFYLPADVLLQPGDELQVFLTDAAGNKTPAFDTPYIDALFKAATKVTVKEDQAPLTLNVISPQQYDQGQQVSEEQFLTDIDATANVTLIEKTTSGFENVDFNTVGVYVVEVTGKDRLGRTATRPVVVLITDADTVVDLARQGMMRARSFVIQRSKMRDANFVERAEAKAWTWTQSPEGKVTVNNNASVQMRGNKPTTVGEHPVVFEAVNESGDVAVEKAITVYAYRVVNEGANEALNATRFTIELEQLLELDEQTYKEAFIDLAHVHAYNLNTMPPTELSSNEIEVVSPLPPKFGGNYQITFRTLQGKTQTTVIAEVRDQIGGLNEIEPHTFGASLDKNDNVRNGENGQTLLNRDADFSAEKFVEYRKNKTNLTEAQFLADAKVVVDEQYNVTTDFDDKVKIDTLGVYPVTITRTDATTGAVQKATTRVLVINDNVTIDQQHEVMMHTSSRMSKFFQFDGRPKEVDWVAYFKVQAWDLRTSEKLKVRLQGEVPLVYGLHTVTFEALNANDEIVMKKTADVYIGSTNEDPNAPIPFFLVNGVDFEIPLELAKDPANFLNHAQVAAYRYDDASDWKKRTPVDVTFVNAEDTIKKIQEQGTGDYVITFLPEGSKELFAPRTVTVTDSKVSMHTHDVVMSVAEAQATDVTDMVRRTVSDLKTENKLYTKKLFLDEDDDDGADGLLAVVYDKVDAQIEATEISDDEISALKAIKKGQTEPLTITITARDNAGDFTTQQVNVYVYDEVNNEKKQAINAHNFAIKRSDINRDAYEAQFIALANATVYDFNKVPPVMSNVLQVVINQQMFSTVGDYTVTFRTPDGNTSKDVIAHVYEDINETKDEAMNANNFAIGLSDLPPDDNALNEKLITLAEAKGYDISSIPSAEPTEIEVKVSTLRPTKRGEYDVTFETITGKMKLQVKMYVYDVVNYKEERAMNAKEFTMPWQLMQKATEERLIALAEVAAYDITDIKEQPPVVAAEQIMLKSTRPTQVGIHDVTFGIVDRLAKPNSVHETEITVKANVIDTNIKLDADEALALSLADAQNINATKLKHEGHVQASTANKHDDGTDAIITDEDITVIAGLDELRSLDTAPDPEDPITVVIQAKDSVGDKTTKDIEVYVYDAVNEERTYSINAHSFALKLSDIPQDDQGFKAKMIEAADAQAFDLSIQVLVQKSNVLLKRTSMMTSEKVKMAAFKA